MLLGQVLARREPVSLGKRLAEVDREAEMAQKDDALLTPAEVAALFRVDPKTVTRWAKAGKLSSIRTLGGHRRYRADEVKKFLDGAKQSGEMPYVGMS